MSDFPIIRVDHIEFYVGNAKQAAHYFQTAFGFTLVAYSGLETGNRTHAAYLLTQGKVRLVVRSALTADDFVAQHVRRHGDGVRTVALAVPDVERAYALATERGAVGVMEPTALQDRCGLLCVAAIQCYGTR